MAENWELTAMYRLGRHWEDVGEYDRAEAAYAEVLKSEPDNQAALYNRAMALIRLGEYGMAETTLAGLWTGLGVHIVSGTVTAPPHRRGEAYAAVYAQALVQHYLGRLDDAERLSEALSSTLLTLAEPDPTECAALMLHASIIIVAIEKRLGDAAALEPRVLDAIVAATSPQRLRLTRTWLKGRLGAPADLEQYARAIAESDPRAHYNIACYLARLAPLAGDDPARQQRLRERVREHSRIAFRDTALVSWASRDPALQPLRDDPDGRVLLDTAGERSGPLREPVATPA
jgi:tetratricopeptide (TPR) repeat protein